MMGNRGSAALVALICILWQAAYAADPPPQTYDIRPQSVSAALKAFAAQSNMQVIFTETDTRGATSNGVTGTKSAREALQQILQGTGLDFKVTPGNVVIVRKAAQEPRAAPGPDPTAVLRRPGGRDPSAVDGPHAEGAEDPPVMEEIVVTGSHIRGIENPIAPLVTWNRTDIQETGFGTTQDLMRSLPQNFAGGSLGASETGILGAGFNGASNNEAGTAVNLRGLGENSTLVLIDGHRMAPSDFGSFIDVSVIPIDAIESVEVLTDGASAIYGSDAVGGVVNFRLRRDFQGAETRLHYATALGTHQETLSQTLGGTWDSGGALGLLQFDHNNALSVADRASTSAVPVPTDTLPRTNKYSGFLSAHQEIGPITNLFAEILAARRTVQRSVTSIYSRQDSDVADDSLSATSGLDIDAVRDWRIELSGTYGRQHLDAKTPYATLVPAGYVLGSPALLNTDTISTVDLAADGSLIQLPAGALKLAVGGSYPP